MTKTNLARLYTLISVAVLFFSPQVVLADSSTSVNISNNGANSQNNVNVQNNTGGVNCINGHCTSSGGGSQSTVCINGHCTTSSGNIDMQSDNGNDQVHISNNSSESSVSVTPVPTVQISLPPKPSISYQLSTTPNPTFAKRINHIKKQAQKHLQQLKSHVKSQDAALSSMVQSLENFLNGLFK